MALAVLSLPVIFAQPRSARAADLSTCVADSGASSVPSIHSACGLCGGTSDTTRRGALWINNSSSKDSAIVNADSAAATVSFYLRGQVYACGNSSTDALNAYAIWFAEAGHMKTSDPKVDFITVSSTSMNRGSTSGAFTWSGGGYITGTIDIAKFKANPNTTCTDLGGGAQECTHTVSVNRCSSNCTYENETGDQNPGTGCYGDDSVITMRLDGVGPTEESSDAYFYSNSLIKIDAQGSDIGAHSKKTSNDGSTTVLFSTDESSVDIQFQHELHYVVAAGNFASADVFDEDVIAKYKILDQAGAAVQGETEWKIAKPTDPKSNQDLTGIRQETVTVNLNPGETKTVCRRIAYEKKYLWFKITDDEDTTAHAIDHVRYHWGIEKSSGNEDSVTCATVTRPNNPGGSGPYAKGSANGTIFFAGEVGRVGWNTKASGVNVRRLVRKQGVVFNYSVETGQSGSTTGESRYNKDNKGNEVNDACEYYTGKGALRCSVLNDTALTGEIHLTPAETYSSSDSVPGAERDMAVPDNVGWKYCNSFAYRFEYWYAYVEDGVYSWTHDANRDYWFVYNSACRTIAKKPAIAIWNGSMMSGGGVITSLSPRFKSDDIMGKFANNKELVKTRHMYGSWAEYLDVVYGDLDGLGSGAAFSIGGRHDSGGEKEFCDQHARLTIQNVDCGHLGRSGVLANSAFTARLQTYLADQSENYTTLDSLGSVSGETVTVSQSKIIQVNGDLNINKNIVLANGPYQSIYRLPRVIIFVKGNVNVASNVTQIDAWIFASGTVDTCKDFNSGKTEAVAVQNNGAIYNSPACSRQLVFNGPVYAHKLALHRHYGSDKTPKSTSGDRQTPAEIFNYRLDDYLWAYAQSGRYASSYTESYTREVAPRF